MQISTMKEFDQETLFVDFQHVIGFDMMLASAISEEYYRCGFCIEQLTHPSRSQALANPDEICRFEPFLRRSVQNVVKEYHPDFANQEGESKEFFVAFYNMGAQLKYAHSCS